MILTPFRVATQGLKYYWRPNFALALAVAAATAVLVGALVVGSSMRYSLQQLTFERLGRIDEAIIADHFFTKSFVDSIRKTRAFQQNYKTAAPVILFPNGIVESASGELTKRSSDVSVLGVDDTFWTLPISGNPNRFLDAFRDDSVLINRALATDLGINEETIANRMARVTIRIAKPMSLPSDSALGKKQGLIVSLVELPVVGIVEDTELGRFSLAASQQVPLNIFVALKTLQETLAKRDESFDENPDQINAVFLAGGDPANPPKEDAMLAILQELSPSASDMGVKVKSVALRMSSSDPTTSVIDYTSISTERLIFSDEQAQEILAVMPEADIQQTYLVNTIRKALTSEANEAKATDTKIPYSMITAIDPGKTFRPVSLQGNAPIELIGDDEIVLNEWAANDLHVEVGDKISLKYFEPESTHGQTVERNVELRLSAIAKLTEPSSPFVYRRGQLTPAEYKSPPTAANDPDFTPEVPGLSDSESIEKWDLPFPMNEQLRPEDDSYWDSYRTTPKGFVSFATGKRLWGSRFGSVTGFRLFAENSLEQTEQELIELWRKSPSLFGMNALPLKRIGIRAASGTTPFDALFLGLSMFIIAAALMLVGILFRLGLEQRIEQLGLMAAVGIGHARITRIWFFEMLSVCVLGAIVGVGLGIAYGWGMIWALKTLWVGAIATPFLQLHVGWLPPTIGFLAGALVCAFTLWLGIRRFAKLPARQLLAGTNEADNEVGQGSAKPKSYSISRARWLGWLASISMVIAIVLSIAATQLGGEAQAGAFMSSGFLVLSALLIFVYRRLISRRFKNQIHVQAETLLDLANENARRNPMRSVLIIGLVASATFLIVAISSFRLQPSERSTGGAQWLARSSVPVISDLATSVGRQQLGLAEPKDTGLLIYSLRVKPGQDASCNNLYQSTQPRVLGMPDRWMERFDQPKSSMLWAGSRAESPAEKTNPWTMLNRSSRLVDGELRVPAIIDKNTAMYSLKIYSVGSDFKVHFDSGESVTFEVVGFLENSIFQGSLLIGEHNFETTFPTISGYREFLIASRQSTETSNYVRGLENQLGDYGFDVHTTQSILEQFASVQNTYLNAFQSLGGLGLLLGTFGLAAVQLRSILERRKELALMQAVGFARGRLQVMLFQEQILLLLSGVAVGLVAALAATLPHWFLASASMPWWHLAAILGIVVAVGLIAAWLSARTVMRLPLSSTLRT